MMLLIAVPFHSYVLARRAQRRIAQLVAEVTR